MGRPPLDPVVLLRSCSFAFTTDCPIARSSNAAPPTWPSAGFSASVCTTSLPNHTNGTHFRQRLGADRFERIFQDIVSAAREHGLIRDRLRLKDATHLFADAAQLQPLALAAQVREHLLRARSRSFRTGRRRNASADNLRQTTAEASDADRLAARLGEPRREQTTQPARADGRRSRRTPLRTTSVFGVRWP